MHPLRCRFSKYLGYSFVAAAALEMQCAVEDYGRTLVDLAQRCRAD